MGHAAQMKKARRLLRANRMDVVKLAESLEKLDENKLLNVTLTPKQIRRVKAVFARKNRA